MAIAKSADAFRTISEAAQELDVPQHVLRHWEEVFGQIRPMRRAGGRRYYRPLDLDLLRGVRVLLYDERYTTKGVQKIFKENGAKYIAEIGRISAAGKPVELRAKIDDGSRDAVAPSATSTDASSQDASESQGAPSPPSAKHDLERLLKRLETVQKSLDEATISLEAIAASKD